MRFGLTESAILSIFNVSHADNVTDIVGAWSVTRAPTASSSLAVGQALGSGAIADRGFMSDIASLDVAGVYQASLHLSDQCAVSESVATVVVGSDSPVVFAGGRYEFAGMAADPSGQRGSLQLSRTRVIDARGELIPTLAMASAVPGIAVTWSIVSVPSGSSQVVSALLSPPSNVLAPEFRPDQTGRFQFMVAVEDSRRPGEIATDTVTIDVLCGPSPVAAVAGAPAVSSTLQLAAGVGSATVTLNGAGSTDSDSNPASLTYQWSVAPTQVRQVGAASITSVPQRAAQSRASTASSVTTASLQTAGTTASFAPDGIGTFVLTLTVSDGCSSSSQVVSVTVTCPETAGLVSVSAGADVLRTLTLNEAVPSTIALTGSTSVGTVGAALSLTHEWILEAKPTASALTVGSVLGTSLTATVLRPDVTGAYMVRLRSTDGCVVREDTMLVVISPHIAPACPTITATPSPSQTATPTPSRSPTSTGTPTPTGIPTPTSTATVTPTGTSTSTPTPSPTVPAPSATSTPIPPSPCPVLPSPGAIVTITRTEVVFVVLMQGLSDVEANNPRVQAAMTRVLAQAAGVREDMVEVEALDASSRARRASVISTATGSSSKNDRGLQTSARVQIRMEVPAGWSSTPDELTDAVETAVTSGSLVQSLNNQPELSQAGVQVDSTSLAQAPRVREASSVSVGTQPSPSPSPGIIEVPLGALVVVAIVAVIAVLVLAYYVYFVVCDSARSRSTVPPPTRSYPESPAKGSGATPLASRTGAAAARPTSTAARNAPARFRDPAGNTFDAITPIGSRRNLQRNASGESAGSASRPVSGGRMRPPGATQMDSGAAAPVLVDSAGRTLPRGDSMESTGSRARATPRLRPPTAAGEPSPDAPNAATLRSVATAAFGARVLQRTASGTSGTGPMATTQPKGGVAVAGATSPPAKRDSTTGLLAGPWAAGAPGATITSTGSSRALNAGTSTGAAASKFRTAAFAARSTVAMGASGRSITPNAGTTAGRAPAPGPLTSPAGTRPAGAGFGTPLTATRSATPGSAGTTARAPLVTGVVSTPAGASNMRAMSPSPTAAPRAMAISSPNTGLPRVNSSVPPHLRGAASPTGGTATLPAVPSGRLFAAARDVQMRSRLTSAGSFRREQQ